VSIINFNNFSKMLKPSEYIYVWLTFFHYLCYEIVFFFYDGFLGGVLSSFLLLWKTLFPVALLLYGGSGVGRSKFHGRILFEKYRVAFFIFLVWNIIPSVFSPYGFGAVIELFKLIPRMLFFIGLFGFVIANSQAF